MKSAEVVNLARPELAYKLCNRVHTLHNVCLLYSVLYTLAKSWLIPDFQVPYPPPPLPPPFQQLYLVPAQLYKLRNRWKNHITSLGNWRTPYYHSCCHSNRLKGIILRNKWHSCKCCASRAAQFFLAGAGADKRSGSGF